MLKKNKTLALSNSPSCQAVSGAATQTYTSANSSNNCSDNTPGWMPTLQRECLTLVIRLRRALTKYLGKQLFRQLRCIQALFRAVATTVKAFYQELLLLYNRAQKLNPYPKAARPKPAKHETKSRTLDPTLNHESTLTLWTLHPK